MTRFEKRLKCLLETELVEAAISLITRNTRCNLCKVEREFKIVQYEFNLFFYYIRLEKAVR